MARIDWSKSNRKTLTLRRGATNIDFRDATISNAGVPIKSVPLKTAKRKNTGNLQPKPTKENAVNIKQAKPPKVKIANRIKTLKDQKKSVEAKIKKLQNQIFVISKQIFDLEQKHINKS